MNTPHLSMAELLAVRDLDRSEPAFAMAHRHVEQCAACRNEVDRLHQRSAQLRALPHLAPAVDVFPRVRRQLVQVRRQRYWRAAASLGVAAAAALVIWIVGDNLASPPPLSAEAQIADVKSSSERLEERLVEWAPRQRALDGGTVIVVLELEDRIAEVDQKLQEITSNPPEPVILKFPVGQDERRLDQELQLWREREGLLSALLNVHVHRTARIAL